MLMNKTKKCTEKFKAWKRHRVENHKPIYGYFIEFTKVFLVEIFPEVI